MGFFKFIFSKAFLKQLLLALLVLVLLVFGLLYWLRASTNHDQRIAVPDLSKMSLGLVQQELENADLNYVVIDSSNYNPDYPTYSVIEQNPAAGKFVKEGRKIYLVLNPSGYRKIEIPQLVGRTQRQVEPTLLALGFKIGKIDYRDHISSDEVLELRHDGKTLKVGDALRKTSVIDLVVGNGKGSYRTSGDAAQDVINDAEELDDAGF
ncbi:MULTISPECIES: PASTA domain-containing protein [Leeuwenhoekiella]|uniref:PASTA domain-containing protein n=1 Tax=Leeuwenhoekiella palythoae TaxID=573501 RepID=A0A1M5UH36_9FLAO|nr:MULTISPECIES: PASTA domain-containing protein [Leeuwenhoekiella]MEC7784045.1 PASTA domain-containing protein [Bacteroidota bacterium]MEC8683416.1 PASTA domain-containing protein [Bacteroidota bacterium]MEE3147555.1 PASTA domain-containing protein [Bacteroidota bacterium]MEE3227269.1 PASTA domain-containing protein [Bacteroidota bacterium]MEE3244679.1 PASTA domain-containing protein [Bacteroidota bacterium]|tara:strand:- start:163 stop:786 length:624 start_codon:yes stop_codon:yes gene_type:complete